MTLRKISIGILYVLGFFLIYRIILNLLFVILIPVFYFVYVFFIGDTADRAVIRSGTPYLTLTVLTYALALILTFYVLRRIYLHYQKRSQGEGAAKS